MWDKMTQEIKKVENETVKINVMERYHMDKKTCTKLSFIWRRHVIECLETFSEKLKRRKGLELLIL